MGKKKFQKLVRQFLTVRNVRAIRLTNTLHSQKQSSLRRCNISTSADRCHSLNQYVSDNMNIQLTTKKVGQQTKFKVGKKIELKKKNYQIS